MAKPSRGRGRKAVFGQRESRADKPTPSAETQLQEFLDALAAVRKGDLSRKLKKDREDIFGELADSYNNMVDTLNTFSAEVTRVAREVGTEGKLGGQADVPGVAGTWKELTDNVNGLARNLSDQVRNIAKVVTAVSEGDLTQKITVEARGEVAELADVVNKMVDDLNKLAGEVSRVAQVAGAEGRLSERAAVEGVAGSWKDIVDTLNALIDSIATPIQEMMRIAVAMSEGDL